MKCEVCGTEECPVVCINNKTLCLEHISQMVDCYLDMIFRWRNRWLLTPDEFEELQHETIRLLDE